MLAQEVCAPILKDPRQAPELWRFHRRAAHDATGHQFSLIFYAPSVLAQHINTAISNNEALRSLLAHNTVQSVQYDEPGAAAETSIAATSDPQWSPAIAKAWPWYAMGVSRLWLGLIESTASELERLDASKAKLSLSERMHRYREINDQVTALWQREGSHAFLHHLNALFGYQPVIVEERREINF